MKKIIAALFFVALAYSSNGKLVGTVVQKSDNAPAVGVNIIIVDTYLVLHLTKTVSLSF